MDTYSSLHDEEGKAIHFDAPQECEKAKEEWLPVTDDGIMPRFLDDYEITNNADDCVKVKDISEWLTKLDLGVSKAKLKEEIKKHCEINNLAHVLFTNQTKTIAGKKAKVWKKVKALKGDDDYLGVILGS